MGLMFYFELLPGPYFPAMGVFCRFNLLVSSPLLTFLIGFVWGGIYYRIPNIAGSSVFHAIAGMLALLAGVARNM